MKRLSLLVLLVAAILALMVLTAAPAFAADSPPAVGGQSGGTCSGQGSNAGVILPPGSSGIPPGGVGGPGGGGCSSGCSSQYQGSTLGIVGSKEKGRAHTYLCSESDPSVMRV